MRIDKDKLKALAALNDEELWKTIRGIAGGHGIKVPENPPASCDMAKIREALLCADRQSITSALKTIDKYRKGKC